MPSFQDSAVIFFLALLLFGPKKLPELARQLGKLMGEFRRASNEFRIQMEDELRASEQAEKQKQIAAMEAAAPTPPLLSPGITTTEAHTIALPSAEQTAQTIADSIEDPLNTHPHMAAPDRHTGATDSFPSNKPTPLPIANSGDLNLMPPSTGLPVARSTSSLEHPSQPEGGPETTESLNLAPLFDSIPDTGAPSMTVQSEQRPQTAAVSGEAVTHG